MTPEHLEATLRYWQKVLRLQDWTISVKFERMKTLGTCMGDCSTLFPHSDAVIRVRHPDDYREGDDILIEIEDTVVHELLHLHLYIAAGKTYDVSLSEEQVIGKLARAYVLLNRGIRPAEWQEWK